MFLSTEHGTLEPFLHPRHLTSLSDLTAHKILTAICPALTPFPLALAHFCLCFPSVPALRSSWSLSCGYRKPGQGFFHKPLSIDHPRGIAVASPHLPIPGALSIPLAGAVSWHLASLFSAP